MPLEIELKARIDDLASLRARLEGLGAHCTAQRAFEDNLLFDDGTRRVSQAGEALRVRLVDGRALLTFKGAKRMVDGVKSREELEVWCDAGPPLVAILERIGFAPMFRYQKYRECWHLDDAELMLDETPAGTFLEIEGSDDAVRALARRLEIGADRIVTESYPALFRRLLDERGEDPTEMVFR